jgi:hypothetical protein
MAGGLDKQGSPVFIPRILLAADILINSFRMASLGFIIA